MNRAHALRGTQPAWSWFYSAPVENVAVRRGDPLGMRGIAEQFADELAPGLSNRTVDARWFTILAWCLEHGHAAWRLYGENNGDGLSTRDATRSLYHWVRPLELLWVARTLTASEDRGKGRQLPGVRAVRRWEDARQRPKHFGFSSMSYDRYRFTGIYGAYRIGLRALPGLTLGDDGWRLGNTGRELAEIAAQYVSVVRMHRRGKGRRPIPEAYWLRSFRWDSKLNGFLPTILDEPSRLPSAERKTLRSLLFGPNPNAALIDRAAARRRAVVGIAATTNADDQVEIFRKIATKLAPSVPLLRALPAFSSLADAGVAAMNAVWDTVKSSGSPGIKDVVDDPDVVSAFNSLVDAAARWDKDSKRFHTGFRIVDSLAGSIGRARGDGTKLLRALEAHHRNYGGGLQWVRISADDRVVPLAPLRGGRSSDYRFRVSALCRMGVPCGVIDRMPRAYAALEEEEAAE